MAAQIPIHDRPTDPPPRGAAAIRRVAWGAIFAGAVVAIVVQLGLSLMGLGLGFGAFDPATDGDTLSGLGIGAGIWLLVSTIVALFTGGYVAGRMAGLPRRPDGLLHGIVSWAVVTLLTFYLMTSAVGTLLSSAVGFVGQGLQTLGAGVEAVAPEAARAIGQQLPDDVRLSDLQDDAAALLRDAGLSPDTLAARAETAASDVAAAAQQSPSAAEAELRESLRSFLETGRELDRQNAVNLLTARTDLTEAEAEATIRRYEQTFQQAARTVGRQVDSTAANLREGALRGAGQVTDAIANAAWWGLIAMALGAASAAAGGAAGSPHDLPASPAVRRE